MFFELPGTFILPICWLLTWCNLVFWSGESIRMRAFDLILCWRRLAPPQAAPLCYSIIQGRNGAADFPTENCSSIVWLCQNTLLPIMTNAPSESQQHKMVPFFPMKMLAGYNLLNWGQWIFFFVLLSKNSCLGALSTFHQTADLFTFLLQHHQMLKMSDLLFGFFLMLPQIFCLKLHCCKVKLLKFKKKYFSKVSQLNKCTDFYLRILTYIASHGLASSFLGDLWGFLELLLHFELCFRQCPVVLSGMGSLPPSTPHLSNSCTPLTSAEVSTAFQFKQMSSFHFSWLLCKPLHNDLVVCTR